MILALLPLDSRMPLIAVTMSPSAAFESFTAASVSFTSPAALSEFSAFLRVMDAISSIDADVSSSEAACSVAPCDND